MEKNREVETDQEHAVDLVKAPRRPSQPPPLPTDQAAPRRSSQPPPLPTDQAARASSPEFVPEIPLDGGAGNGLVSQMLPPHSSSSPPPPPTRFNTAAPLAPPRPNPTGIPPRPSNPPPAPRLPAGQDVEKIAELQEQLDQTRRTLVARDAEIRTLLAQRDARIAELESVKSQLAAREFGVKELEFAVLAKETKVRDLEKEMESLRSPGEGPGDDLQQIRGIGRGFERELRRIGVRTFAQIAEWSQADIDAIAPRIKAQAERIRRDGWVQHAGELVNRRNK